MKEEVETINYFLRLKVIETYAVVRGVSCHGLVIENKATPLSNLSASRKRLDQNVGFYARIYIAEGEYGYGFVKRPTEDFVQSFSWL